MHKAKKPILIAAGIIAALLLFSVGILPVIVRSQAVKAIAKAIGRSARIGFTALFPW